MERIITRPTFDELEQSLFRAWTGENPFLRLDFSTYLPDDLAFNEMTLHGVSVFFDVLSALIREKTQVFYLAVEYTGQDLDSDRGIWVNSEDRLLHLEPMSIEFDGEARLFSLKLSLYIDAFAADYCKRIGAKSYKQRIDGSPSVTAFHFAVYEIIGRAKRDHLLTARGGIRDWL